MVNSKQIEFGGNLGENVDHFLRGFSLAFASEEAKLEAGAVPESSESKAYRIITHLRPKSEAARFVSRLPPQTTQDYTALSQALRGRFENSAELEEEQRYAEELFLSLRQRRGQSIDDYIRLTRRVARGMTAENQHLVATQFVKGLDSRELRVQTMSGLSSRPTVNEAITKVQRLADIIDIDSYTGIPGITSGEDDSDSEKEKDIYTGYWDRKKTEQQDLKRKKKKAEMKAEKKISQETERIRKNIEELKEMLTQKQSKEETSNQGSLGTSEKLPVVEAYSMGHRLAPPAPVSYPQQAIYTQPSTYNGPSQFNPGSQSWSDQVQNNSINYGVSQVLQERQQWQPYEQRPFDYGSRGYRRAQPPQMGPPQYSSAISQPATYPNRLRDRSQLVCYQCGIVGHLRYECHLLPRPANMFGARFSGQPGGNMQQGSFPENSQNVQAVARPNYPMDNHPPVPPARVPPQHQSAQMGNGRFATSAAGSRAPPEARAVEPERLSSALDGMVVEVEPNGETSAKAIRSSRYVEMLDYSDMEEETTDNSPEVMAGERARLRSQVEGSSSSAEKGPAKRRQRVSFEETAKQQEADQQWKAVRKSRLTHHPIRLMVDKPAFDYISGFRDAPVMGLTWGQFFDLSPESKRQFVKLMVQERSKVKASTGKGKAKAATSRVMESAFGEAALIGATLKDEEVLNFYTSARVRSGDKTFEISRVLLDAGSVVNLAPISILQSLGVVLHLTKDLVIRTAASNLVPLEYYADLEIEVASVVAPMRVYAMPATCEPTYGLLLSRRWLRYCHAIGDYTSDSYVIRDKFGVDHEVPSVTILLLGS